MLPSDRLTFAHPREPFEKTNPTG